MPSTLPWLSLSPIIRLLFKNLSSRTLSRPSENSGALCHRKVARKKKKKSLKSLAHFEICLAFRVGISFAKAWARHYCFCNDKNSVEWQNHYLQAKCSLDPTNQPASTQVCDDHLEYKTNSDLSCKHTLQHKQSTRPLFIHSTKK